MTAKYRALIIDMDGVLWHGDAPLPGIVGFFAFLRQAGVRFVLATNNSSATVQQYRDKLAAFGVAVSPAEILTSAQATAQYIAESLPAARRVYTIGGPGLHEALAERNFERVGDDGAEADVVAVGWDRGMCWKQLARACLLIRKGARFIGTNPDRTYPTPEGLVPGNGAILAALEACTGVTPTLVGKPEPLLYEQAIKRLDTPKAVTAGLGDRLDTDILGAQRAGLHTILVLSGVTTENDLANSSIRPDDVYADVTAIVRAWS